ncbi:MAG: PQQ-dependent sugar dehydrogenase [bacterium]|nr:PQQ-dependent sugar dehydrogenase [bacterium]
MRYLLVGLVAAIAISACGSSDPEGLAQPTLAPVTTTTSLATTTAPPPTESPGSSTTSAASTTSAPPTTVAPEPVGALEDLQLESFEAASGFAQPVLLVSPPADERWFVVDQSGVIWVSSGSDPAVFLDINADVLFEGEQGLLGLAFHPDFVGNDLFYVYYIASNGQTVVESFRGMGDAADPESRSEILRIDQPAGNHNGGMITFGPDGNLWIGMGDGGGANDQFGHGQRSDSLLASMLRIAVGPDIDGYEIPAGNIADEVWAIGLRNPWRFTFDGDDLWIADVGQNKIEEVDVVDWTAGNPNFGWPIMEGTECFQTSGCDQAGLVLPVYEYTHGDGCSITGGVVYRGSAMPELSGQFLFADYCTGWLRSVGEDGQVWDWFPAGTFSGATGFGVDAAGEPFVLTSNGSVFGLKAAE